MSLETLVTIAPPPLQPIAGGGTEQWSAVEQELGTALPRDYKQAVNLYGLGYFAEYVSLFNPFVPLPSYLHLIQSGRSVLKFYERGRSVYPAGNAPFPTYPEKGGLLPWGRDDNAGLLCWRTYGQPDEWTTIILDSHYSDNYQEYPNSMSCFLTEWISGQVTVKFYPEDVDVQQTPRFVPFLPLGSNLKANDISY